MYKIRNIIKILIVEDDVFSRKVLTTMFEYDDSGVNFNIVESDNGEDAIEKILTNNFDLILLDIHLPKKNGITVLRTIKRSRRFLLTPIIVLTADKEEKIKALQYGASDFILKPYDILELKLKIFNQVKVKKYSTELKYQIIHKAKELQSKIDKIEDTQRKFLLKLAMQSEKQMSYSDSLRAEKVATYTKKFSMLCCHCSPQMLKNVYYSAAFHNIGFLSLPNNIKNKDGQYTTKDRELMQKHIEHGAKFLYGLENTDLLNIAKPIIEEYCERWDGKGYPRGLEGDDISFYARIVSIVVYFNALTSPRGYREKIIFSDRDVYKLIQNQSGKIFDPILVDVFLINFDKFIAIKNRISSRARNRK